MTARTEALSRSLRFSKRTIYDSFVPIGLLLFPLLMPGYLDLGTRILILILCAMSLDIVVGYCGLITLGHSALFGVGAYAAGIFALRVSSAPELGLLVGGLAHSLGGFGSLWVPWTRSPRSRS